MVLHSAWNYFSRVFRNLYVLTFISGFSLASLIYFRIEATYEKTLFLSIKNYIDHSLDNDDTQDSLVIKAMRTSNNILGSRASMFKQGIVAGAKADFFGPSSVDLMTSRGACGSDALVLARIFKTYGMPVRIAQMEANGKFAAHNLVEVKTHHGWVALDATYNAYYVRPDGKLASFADVQGNWNYYAKQVPPGYDMHYRFEGVRYTNWHKVPLVLPLIKKCLNLCIGAAKADTICLRCYVLAVYNIYFYLILLLSLPLYIVTLGRFIRAARKPGLLRRTISAYPRAAS